MKKRVLKKWVSNLLCIESAIIFSFIAMLNDMTFIGFLIVLLMFVKLYFNVYILNKYTNILNEDHYD